MKSSARSVFGYLMNILNIRTSAMAQSLHVDSSLVSKWKTGSRQLTKDSPYFDDVIEYLAENLNGDFNSLCMALRGYICAERLKDISDSEELLRAALSGNISMSEEQSIIFGDQRTIPMLCFDNNAGRREAVRRAFCFAQTLGGGEITVIDSEEFRWLLDDDDFLEYFISFVTQLLKNDFKFTFVLHYSSSNENIVNFFYRCAPILFHRNVKWYYTAYYDESVMNLSMLKINNSVMAVGISVGINRSTTMIFTDKSLIEHYTVLMDSVVKLCTPIFDDFELTELLSVAEGATRFGKNDALYSFLPVPAFIAVRPSILQVVLKDNNVNEETYEKTMKLNRDFRLLTKSYNINLGNSCNKFVQIFQLEKLIERVKKRTFISSSLTTACGKEMVISPRHHAAVLRQLVDTLLVNDNVWIVIASEKNSKFLPMINCWVKENGYMLQMDRKGFRICDESIVVNAASASLEGCVRRVPPSRREKDSVADFLNGLADELESL